MMPWVEKIVSNDRPKMANIRGWRVMELGMGMGKLPNQLTKTRGL
jgi:hypothetical protein